MKLKVRTLENKKLERILLERSIYRKAKRVDASFDEFLTKITEWIISVLDCDGVYVFLDDPKKKRLQLSKNNLILISQFSNLESMLGLTTKASTPNFIAKAYRTREIINYPLDKVKMTGFEKKFQFNSCLSVPIQIKGSPIGVLLLTHTKKNAFSERKYALLGIISDFVATTIANYLDKNRSYHLSITDNLTGLYNDRYFHEVLAQEVDSSLRFKTNLHLVFFDLDHLKQVNDTYGHLAGSAVLSEIGTILVKYRRYLWTARYGGDEFVIIVKNKTKAEVIKVVEDIRRKIENYTFLSKSFYDQRPLRLKSVITASFGIAGLEDIKKLDSQATSSKDVNHTKNLLLKKSDEAVYKAKTDGKNKVVYSAG